MGNCLFLRARGWGIDRQMKTKLQIPGDMPGGGMVTGRIEPCIIVCPNGNVECRSSFSKESASIIINISKRNWKTVANTIFKHEEIKAELLGPITKAVDAEFTDYCKDSRKSIISLRKHRRRRKWGEGEKEKLFYNAFRTNI